MYQYFYIAGKTFMVQSRWPSHPDYTYAKGLVNFAEFEVYAYPEILYAMTSQLTPHSVGRDYSFIVWNHAQWAPDPPLAGSS